MARSRTLTTRRPTRAPARKAAAPAKPPASEPGERAVELRLHEGKALRQRCPRASHAELGRAASDRDPIALIAASNKDRIGSLIPVRHTRMLESPFAFFRGSAIVQAADLSRTPASGIQVQACGDCHLMNFGGFATPERDLVFDLNDFDETFPGPWEWDVKRLCASLVLAGRWRGFSEGQARDAAVAAAARYREKIVEYADLSALEVWYNHVTFGEIRESLRGDRRLAQRFDAALRRARRSNSEEVYGKLTTEQNGQIRIIDQPPLIFHPDFDVHTAAHEFTKKYFKTLREDYRALLERFRFIDAAVKVVGVGSVGTRCLIALMLDEADQPLFLQIKEARPSVLQAYTGRSRWRNNGERVVAGQRLLQAVSDIFLGWLRTAAGRDFYVRQLRDMKVSVNLERFSANDLERYGQLCGRTLARAHAKAGAAPPIAGYLGSSDAFDVALGRYAVAYADQVERDYKAFRTAVRNGKLNTEAGGSLTETMIA
jgi:uncharacterized protein (DUF2252 family)